MPQGPVTREELAAVAGTVARVGTAVERVNDHIEHIPVMRALITEMRRDLIGDGNHQYGLMHRVASLEATVATLSTTVSELHESQKRLVTLIETIGSRNLEEHQAIMTRIASETNARKLKTFEQDAKIDKNTKTLATAMKTIVAVITGVLISLMASVGSMILDGIGIRF